MKKDIDEAKLKADVVILSLHFGNEYERMPSKEQKDLAQFAADQGVHAVIGHHPHVLQPNIRQLKRVQRESKLKGHSLCLHMYTTKMKQIIGSFQCPM